MSQLMRRKGTTVVIPFVQRVVDDHPGWYEIVNNDEVTAEVQKEAVIEQKEQKVAEGLSLKETDKVQSIVNAVKILPPNNFVTYKGRLQPKLSDVSAVCGFEVKNAQLDEAYAIIQAELEAE